VQRNEVLRAGSTRLWGVSTGGLPAVRYAATSLLAVTITAVTDLSLNDHGIRPPSLLALPSFLAGNVARIGHRLLLQALAEHDLRLPHAAVFAALSDFGPLAQYELADRLDIRPSHLVRYVDVLEQRGLVGRERDREDRRRQIVALTRSGRLLWRRLQPLAERSQAQLLDVLSEAERETLLTLLARVLKAHDETRLQVAADEAA
jgi:DNA-binding MarR family transcriptional regulator